MSCVIEEIPFDPTDFDKALGDLLIGHEGYTQEFLVSIFSFLKRKTNFFKEPEPKRRVLDALRTAAGEAAGADGFKAGFFGAPKASAAKQVRLTADLWPCLLLWSSVNQYVEVLESTFDGLCDGIHSPLHEVEVESHTLQLLQQQRACTCSNTAPAEHTHLNSLLRSKQGD